MSDKKFFTRPISGNKTTFFGLGDDLSVYMLNLLSQVNTLLDLLAISLVMMEI